MEKLDLIAGSSWLFYRDAAADVERDLEVVCKRKVDLVLI